MSKTYKHYDSIKLEFGKNNKMTVNFLDGDEIVNTQIMAIGMNPKAGDTVTLAGVGGAVEVPEPTIYKKLKITLTDEPEPRFNTNEVKAPILNGYFIYAGRDK